MRSQQKSSIKLPGKLLDELGLDSAGRATNTQRRQQPVDRKSRRKEERQQRKLKQRFHAGLPQRGSRGSKRERNDDSDDGGEDDEDEDEDEDGSSPPAPAHAPSRKRGREEEESVKSILKKTKPVAPQRSETASAGRSLSRAVKDRLAQDDAEINYLEKKLKIKDSKKVPKSFDEDGLGYVLDVLKDDYLDDRQERAAKRNRLDQGNESMDEDEGSGEDEEDDGLDALLGDGMDLDESEEEDDLDEEDDEDMEEEEEFKGFSDSDSDSKSDSESVVENDQDTSTESTSIPQNSDPSPNPGKYIPPSLRKPAATENEQLVRLRRQVQGLLNRLSEANLLSILTEIEGVYRTNPRGHVTTILTDIIINIICDRSSLLDTFMILYGGFVAGVYKLVGTDFGANMVQRIVEDFDIHHAKTNGIQDPAAAGKECTNLISYLSELYNFQVISSVLVFDFIRMFLAEITELHTELLLKVVRNSGPQLRTDDPTALKDLVLMMQPSIAKIGQANLSTRTKFMIETLTNLKNNRLKSTTASSAVTTEATTRMKKLLGSLNSRQLRATEPLRASLSDIRNTETKGKWWLVGASWAGTAATTTNEPERQTKAIAKYDSDSDVDTAMPDLHALARAHRMNTEIRRAIFITLLSSTDFTDAYNKILKLHLKRAQEREIPRVLLHCAAAEAAYNPYYTLIAKKFCATHALRMTFTFTLWEYFRRFGEDDGSGSTPADDIDDDEDEVWKTKSGLRKILNLARLYGSLVADGCLGITVLKILNWAYLQDATKSFLEVFFMTVLSEAEDVRNVFSKVDKDNHALARGLLYFLKKHVNGEVATTKEERKRVKKGVKVAVKTLKELVAQSVVDD